MFLGKLQIGHGGQLAPGSGSPLGQRQQAGDGAGRAHRHFGQLSGVILFGRQPALGKPQLPHVLDSLETPARALGILL